MNDNFKNRVFSDLKKIDIHDYMKLIGIDVDYEGVAQNFTQLDKILNAYSLNDLWNYPIDELEHCNEMCVNVVVVYYCDEMGINERLYEYENN